MAPAETPYRLSWDELRSYWETHDERRARVDWASDPEGLDNVLWPGAPSWVNQHLARWQRAAFESLLSLLPLPSTGARALDVGCGTGRWTRLLVERGYAVTGIDLQAGLLERNRAAIRGADFRHGAVQDLDGVEPFDLVTSVTVLQHMPPAEQEAAVANMGRLLRPRGHALVLENVCQQNAYVFANPPAGWEAMFARHGLALVARQPYDFSPALRAYGAIRRRALALAPPRWRHRQPPDPSAFVAQDADPTDERVPGAVARLDLAVRRLAVSLDDMAEPRLMSRPSTSGSVHCGFLFRAPAAVA